MILQFRSRCRAVLLLALCLLGSSLASGKAAAQERAPTPPSDTTETNGISARGALLRSFAVPGWGQIYAQAPGRGAVYFGMEAASVWMLIKSRAQLSSSRSRDRFLRESSALPEGEISSLTRARSRQFEDWATMAVALALFSGADAYVTAQLSDFTEQVQVGPGSEGGLQIRAAVPVGPGR